MKSVPFVVEMVPQSRGSLPEIKNTALLDEIAEILAESVRVGGVLSGIRAVVNCREFLSEIAKISFMSSDMSLTKPAPTVM